MKRGDTILMVVGLALFACVASRVGWIPFLHQLTIAPLAMPVLVSVSFLRLVLQTHARRIALREEGVAATFR